MTEPADYAEDIAALRAELARVTAEWDDAAPTVWAAK